MINDKLPCMKHEPVSLCRLACRFCVDGVSDDRSAKVEHVDTDLMSPPSVQITAHECGVIFSLVENSVVGDSRLTRARIDYSHFESVHRMAPDMCKDSIFMLVRCSL